LLAKNVGQAGRGNNEEFGLLSLEFDENFCMGGPGIIMSRQTLKQGTDLKIGSNKTLKLKITALNSQWLRTYPRALKISTAHTKTLKSADASKNLPEQRARGTMR
jgi:hypothetical protein